MAARPESVDALNNLGNALRDAGRLEEAIASFQSALRLKPDHGDVHTNLSIPLLASGRFEEGWRELEWRWKSTLLGGAVRAFSQPLWQGEAGGGRTLLIHAEQGFGDTLQFCRYAKHARGRGFHVVMEVQRPLQRLVRSLEGVEEVVARGDALPPFDLHCPMMSLTSAFRTTLETIPAKLPYLGAAPADLEEWRTRLDDGVDALRVGLVWAGQARGNAPDLMAANRNRSVAPEVLAPLLSVKGVRFFSLQKEGPRVADRVPSFSGPRAAPQTQSAGRRLQSGGVPHFLSSTVRRFLSPASVSSCALSRGWTVFP